MWFDWEGKHAVLEPTAGEVIFRDDIAKKGYDSGFIYKKPSDLWVDLKKKMVRMQ